MLNHVLQLLPIRRSSASRVVTLPDVRISGRGSAFKDNLPLRLCYIKFSCLGHLRTRLLYFNMSEKEAL